MGETVLSFSGGKDSVLALYYLKQQRIPVEALVTTVWKESGETVAHNESLERLERQAESLRIPIEWVVTDFENYGSDFADKLNELKKKYELKNIAFGDIYLEGHREWGESLAESTGLNALYPLWRPQEEAKKLLDEYVAAGFKSKVIKVDESKLPKDWVGREVNQQFIEDILKFDVCPLGESGEYHTYVYDGPIFSEKLNISL